MNQPQLYNTEEAAKILKISTRTVKMYAGAGRIQAQKIAGAWKFTEESLNRFLKGENPKPKASDALGVMVPGLARELRELLAYLIETKAKPEAIEDLTDILQDYIAPMELLAASKDKGDIK